MNKTRHEIIMRYLNKFYNATNVKSQVPMIEKIINDICKDFLNKQKREPNKSLDVMSELARPIVMTSGILFFFCFHCLCFASLLFDLHTYKLVVFDTMKVLRNFAIILLTISHQKKSHCFLFYCFGLILGSFF